MELRKERERWRRQTTFELDPMFCWSLRLSWKVGRLA